MPGGFAGLATSLGLASDFKASAYGGLDSGKGFGQTVPGSNQWGNQSQGALRDAGNYQAGALQSLNDPRIAKDYDRAGAQVTAPQYNGGMANLLYQQGVDKSIAAQNAMAHSANPNQSGLASYNAAQQGAAIQQNAVGQGALAEQQMRAQYDQLRAQTDLSNRQQNLGMLGLSQQNAQYGAGLNAQLAGQQQGMGLGLAGLQLQNAGQQMQGEEAYQQLASGNYNAAQGINAGVAANQAAAGGQLFGSALKGAEGAVTGGISLANTGDLPGQGVNAPQVASDERIKTDAVSEGTKRRSLADAFLDHLHPYSYEYKDSANEPRESPTGGRYLGVMAQDVERAPGVGRQIVTDTPRGKALESGAMLSGLAAGVGRLHERLAELEAKRGRKGGEA